MQEKELLKKDFILIKPHHFLDFLYDMAVNERHNEENLFGNNNGLLVRMFLDGKIKRIKFTPFVDDVCAPCMNLKNHKTCLDIFDEITSKKYGTNSKHIFNYQLDMKLHDALPSIYDFDKVYEMVEILKLLKDNLTPKIISLYLWDRENRVENTFIGIDKAIKIYTK